MESIISRIKKSYYEGEYKTFLNLLKTIDKTSAIYWACQLYRFRALQESGKFSEANIFLKECLSDMAEDPMKPSFLLWEIYSDTFKNAPSDIGARISQLDSVTFSINDKKNEALRLGLKARLIELGISLGLLSSLKKKDAIDWLIASGSLYTDCNEQEEQLLTDWRIANLYLKGPGSNYEKAKSLVSTITTKAAEIQFIRLLVDSKLLSAALTFEETINNHTIDFVRVQEEYNQIEEICSEHQSGKGEVQVYFSLGSILLEYGLDSGLPLLTEAIDKAKSIREFTLQQQAWRNTARWHMLRGEEAENIKAEAEVNKLNSEVTLQLSTDIEAMYNVFIASKQGDAGYIYDIVEKDEVLKNQWTKNQFQTLQANTLITAGRKEEGIALLKQIVAQYARIGVTPFHSEALFNLSNVLAGENYPEAIYYMNEAIRIDEILEDNYTLAQRYLQLASHTFFSTKPDFQVDDKVEGYFSKSLDYASRSQKLDHLIQLGNLYQTQGQLYAMANDYPKAGEFLTKAENVFTNLNIKPQLAFTLSQQGLCLLKIARAHKNLQTFEDAFGRFEQAASLFRSCNLYTSLWRTLFHQALCNYELAQNLLPDTPDFDASLEQAEHYFREAALIVDELRFVADNRSGLTKQVSISSFGKDKQELYRQAFYANFWLKKDYINALRWLERMKSQAFLEEIAAQNITIKRTKTYEDYKALLTTAENTTDATARQKLEADMEALLTNLFNYSTIEKKATYREPIVDYPAIRQTLLAEEQKLHGKRLLVVQYYCADQLVVAFGLRSDWEQPKIERIPVDRAALQSIAQTLFHQPEGVRSIADEQANRFLDSFSKPAISETDFESQWQQFMPLISPIKSWTDPDDLVCLIPHGVLHDLPLHTLRIEPDQYVIERNPIFYSPSLSILQLSFQKPLVSFPHKAVVFGNPTNDLPFAEKEAIYVANQLACQPLLRPVATKDEWIKSYPTSSLIHFAGHGKAQASNGLEQYIVLANKERITAREIFALKTNADLIVLSGCETGVNEYQAGDELFGLVRSMLHTGVNAVLVSQWAVKDASTAELFMKFYSNNNSSNKVIALQKAMKQMINEGYGFYHWGAFVLIGKWA